MDDDGNIFTFDFLLGKIFKFDKNYKYIKDFCSKGRGPGETAVGGWGIPRITYGCDGFIYMSDPGNRKIIKFDTDGNVKEELSFKARYDFIPAVDADKNLYVLSFNNGAVDVYDKTLKLTRTLLSDKDYMTFVNFKPIKSTLELLNLQPGENNAENPVRSILLNTAYAISGKKRLFVFLPFSSTVYVFENCKLIKKLSLWPKNALRNQKLFFESDEKKRKADEGQSITYIFNRLIVDEDDQDIFYLQGYWDWYKPIVPLYKFNLNGELLDVFYMDVKKHGHVNFRVKKGGLLYGLGGSHADKIFVFKE